MHVGMDQGVIRAQIWSTVARQQGLVFAIFVLSVALAYLLVNRIARPLSQLAEYTRSLATHDFAAGLDIPAAIQTLPERSKDEVGKLAAVVHGHGADAAPVPQGPRGDHGGQGADRE